MSGGRLPALDEPAHQPAAEDGQGRVQPEVRADRERQRPDAEQLHRDDEEDSERHQPPGQTLIQDAATTDALRRNSVDVDVLHLACHGQFRSDNPLFSALRLADGWFTVRDAYGLKLDNALVTLSACETGANVVAPGDELIGLARGFFSAGARSVLLSLWMVDDETTDQMMVDFYEETRRGRSLSASLRAAQLKMLKERPHPFFWSPFVLVGHW